MIVARIITRKLPAVKSRLSAVCAHTSVARVPAPSDTEEPSLHMRLPGGKRAAIWAESKQLIKIA